MRTHPKVSTHVKDLVFARLAELGVEAEISDSSFDHVVDLVPAAQRQLLSVLLEALLGARISWLNLFAELHWVVGRSS